jgi:hypothetical protein
MEPLYKHDCAICVFLGTFNEADLYFHHGPLERTVVARYSSDGPDYSSGLCFADVNPNLREAKRRAIEKNLLVEGD